MNSRERVLCAFNHEQPDRVPCWCGASVEFWEQAKQQLDLDDEQLRQRLGDDFRRVRPEYVGPNPALSPGATYRTVFGIERSGIGYGHPLCHPLADATVHQVHDYAWPDPQWMDISQIKTEAQSFQEQYAILGGDWAPFWHDVIDLLGMETMYIKMYTEPELIDAVFGHVVDFYAAVNERLFDVAADALDIFFFGNDFGSQTGPLLGPDLFERFILPHLRRLADLGRSYGLKTQLHCCGGFRPLIPMMIDARLDAVHAIQPSCAGMDLKGLKQDFGSKIVFNGCIDSHRVLIEGTPATVHLDTRAVLDIMAPNGGFVAGASHDTILEETPLENVLAMFDTIRNPHGIS